MINQFRTFFVFQPSCRSSVHHSTYHKKGKPSRKHVLSMKLNFQDAPEIKEHVEDHYEATSISSTELSMWFSKRFLVTFLIFLGLVNMSILKGNVGIAVVEMTSQKPLAEGNTTIFQPAEFKWETTTISLIMNAYEYGGLFSCLFISLLTKFGGSTTYGVTMMMMSILTMLVPMCVHYHFFLLLVVRFFTGFFDNISYASRSEIFLRWTPLSERSRLMSFSFNGMFLGTTLVHAFCGYLAFKWGWRMVFYSTGLLNLIWSLIWFILVPNNPSKDRCISRRELAYILEGTQKKSCYKSPTPYRSILTSIPFWAMCWCRFSVAWAHSVVVFCLPLFVKDVTQKTTDYIGLISSVPSAVCMLIIPLVGTMMDHLKNHYNAEATKMHKTIMGFNFFFGASVSTFAMLMSNFVVSIVCFSIMRTLSSCSSLLLLLVMIHIAPNHSGAVAALSTFWYSLGNILSQFFIGIMTRNHTLEEWNRVFFVTICIKVISGIVFIVFGSSEPQPWSKNAVPQDQSENTNHKNQVE